MASSVLFRLSLSLIVLGTLACSGTPSDGTPPGSAARATIGTRGGTVESANESVTVMIPAGALASEVELTITEVADPVGGALGTVYEIGPTGTEFAVPVSVRFAFDAALYDPDDPQSLPPLVATVVDKAWVPLSLASIDKTNHHVYGLTRHLSLYAVVPAKRSPSMPRDGGSPASCSIDAREMHACCDLVSGVYLNASVDDDLGTQATSCLWSGVGTAYCSSPNESDVKFWKWWDCYVRTENRTGGSCSDCLIECCRNAPGGEQTCPAPMGSLTWDRRSPAACQCSNWLWEPCAIACEKGGHGVEPFGCAVGNLPTPPAPDMSGAGGIGSAAETPSGGGSPRPAAAGAPSLDVRPAAAGSPGSGGPFRTCVTGVRPWLYLQPSDIGLRALRPPRTAVLLVGSGLRR